MKKPAIRFALAVLAGIALAGCTVQPLHAPTARLEAGQPAALASIYIEPVNDRVGQELRNHLIFLVNNGAGQPSSAAYELALDVVSVRKDAAVIQISDDEGEPTARTVTVSAGYTLVRSSDGVTVSDRRASASASYDVSLQEFANTRAERDAENRAARETAEQIRALIAADLKRAGAV